MPHPLVLGLFQDVASASRAAQALHALGVRREDLSVVARSHDEEGVLARAIDASPGSEIEDSRSAARLGELGGYIVAAIAVVLPGIGPIVAGGPLAAAFGEAAGHAAGDVASTLERAGVPPARAAELARPIEQGAVLLGAHAISADADVLRVALERSGATDVAVGEWQET